MNFIGFCIRAVLLFAASVRFAAAQDATNTSQPTQQPATTSAIDSSESTTGASRKVDPAQLAQRDKLVAQADKLHEDKRLREAIAQCEQVLALERRLFGDGHEEVIGTLERIAQWREEVEDFAGVKIALNELLEIRTRKLGKDHWQVIDTRESLAKLEVVSKLPLAQRRRLYEAVTLNEQMVELFQQGRFGEALSLAQQAVDIRTEILGKNHLDTAASLSNLAQVHQEQGEYDRAGPLFEQVLSMRKTIYGDNHPETATSIHNLAYLYHVKGDYNRAVTLYKQAVSIRKKIIGENHADTAKTLNNLACLYQLQGNYSDARTLFEQALAIKKRVFGEIHQETAETVVNLATLDLEQSDYVGAISRFAKGREIYKQTLGDNHPYTAITINNLAGVYDRLGDYSRAVPLYEQALAIFKVALGENHPNTAATLNNLAEVYREQCDYGRAAPLYEQTVAIRKRCFGHDHPAIATSLNNLALLYQDQGDYARATSLLEEALAIRKKALGDNHPDTAGSIGNLALLYQAQRDYTRAASYFEESLKIRRTALGENHPDTATSLCNLACLYTDRGEYARAAPLLERASKVCEQALGENHPDKLAADNNLARVCLAQGDFPRAAALLEHSYAATKTALGEKHPDAARCLNYLGGLHHVQLDYARASDFHAQAVEFILQHIESSAIVLSERQQLLHSRVARFYLDSAVSCLLHLDDGARTAFADVLRWKGAITMRQRASRVSAEEPELALLFDKLQSVTRRLASLGQARAADKAARWQEKLAELSSEKERLEIELSGKSSVYRKATKQATPEGLASALPAETALVDYLEFLRSEPSKENRGDIDRQPSLVAFVVRRDTPVTMVDLGEIAPIAAAIDTWRKSYGESEESQAAANLLRKKLWQPLEGAIGDSKLVLVSPDSALGRLPFAALPGRKSGSYLIEDYPLAMVPVPQLIPALASNAAERSVLPKEEHLTQRILLLGGVDYEHREETDKEITPPASTLMAAAAPHGTTRGIADDLKWSELPGTSAEVAAVEKLYRRLEVSSSEAVTRLRGAAATEERFRAIAPGHRLLHLATHGYFAAADIESALSSHATDGERSSTALGERLETVRGYSPGLLSGLVLAGANHPPDLPSDPAEFDTAPDDGIITADEIAFLPLGKVDLVVLSACETGLGETAGGEGLLGIQRAFQIAARTTVASLWKVNDEATGVLMTEFYKNLWEKKLTRIEALRQAQLAMLHGYDPDVGALRGAGEP